MVTLEAPRGETPPQSSPTSTACSDGPGVRVGSLPRQSLLDHSPRIGRVGLAPYRQWRRALAETGQAATGRRRQSELYVTGCVRRPSRIRRSSRGARVWRASRAAPVSEAPSLGQPRR